MVSSKFGRKSMPTGPRLHLAAPSFATAGKRGAARGNAQRGSRSRQRGRRRGGPGRPLPPPLPNAYPNQPSKTLATVLRNQRKVSSYITDFGLNKLGFSTTPSFYCGGGKGKWIICSKRISRSTYIIKPNLISIGFAILNSQNVAFTPFTPAFIWTNLTFSTGKFWFSCALDAPEVG